MNSLDIYNTAICSVKDKEANKDLSSLPREIKYVTHMYSNTKSPVVRFVLNNSVIKRNNSIIIGYKCSCGVINEITLNLYLRRVSKNIKGCNACKNADETKRAEHVAYMKGERMIAEKTTRWSDKSLADRINESAQMFHSESSDFIASYDLKHFTHDEFNRIKHKIVSVGNGKITDLSNWEYINAYKVWNQSKYTPMLVNRATNALEKPHYIQWKCEVCDNSFVNRDLEVQKNRIKILCLDCGFTNKTFKLRTMNTPWGKIYYQSNPELHFIKWCIEKSIKVINGPQISYEWNGRMHKYRVDFQLPDKKTIIEIKDNHIWHKIQIERGKWGAKEQCANKWCEENGWTYTIIFPKSLASWKENIMK
jgi:hypothetical protein